MTCADWELERGKEKLEPGGLEEEKGCPSGEVRILEVLYCTAPKISRVRVTEGGGLSYNSMARSESYFPTMYNRALE